MNDTTLRPDDPKLTAYALGELHGDERAAVESALRENPALRSVVEDIRLTAQQLEAALAAESLLEPVATSPLLARSEPVPVNGHRSHASRDDATSGEYRVPRPSGKLIRFPQFYYVIGTLAAACFAVLVVLNRDEHQTRQQARETEARIARQNRKASAPESSAPLLVLTVPTNRAVDEGAITSVASPVVVDTSRPGTTLVSTGAGPGPVEPPRPRSTFLDSNLTLAEQSRPIPTAPTLAPDEFIGGPKLADAPVRANSGNDAAAPLSTGGSDVDLGSDANTRITLNVGAAASEVAHAPTPAIAPQGTAPSTFTVPRSGASATAADDVVRLDAFTVTADRTGFGSAAAMFNWQPTRGIAERTELPRPPPGAQFARNGEVYSYAIDNSFMPVGSNPYSTFSVDVDTASYANVRRYIEQGVLPPREAVRIEELLNYFPYQYAAPTPSRGDAPPFAASLEVAGAPWAPTHRLVRIGLKSREVATADRPAANFVFLVNVSGAMGDATKLPLVKQSLKQLIQKLRPDDQIAIVVYAGASGLALPSTPVAKTRQILDALETLSPVQPASGSRGIQLAYEVANANFKPGGMNRVVLCTDGDLNIGAMSDRDLLQLVGEKAGRGVFLTVLGFGMGIRQDRAMERLANTGKGNVGYIDSRREAERLLVDQLSGTLVTVAKDVKVQVEFNPAKVSSYRLIGYENRLLRKEEFNNDKVETGEIGAGYTVTALYEVVPVGAEPKSTVVAAVEESKYQARGAVSPRLEMPAGGTDVPSNDLLTVKVRYKRPDGFVSRTMEFGLVDAGAQFVNSSPDFQFAAAVAQFGMILRESPHRGTASIRDVMAWAGTALAKGDVDRGRYRGEFIDLVRKTEKLLR